MVKNLPAVQEMWVISLDQEDPLEKGMATHSSILPGEFYGQRSLEGYSPWSHKKSGTTEQLSPSPSEFSKLKLVCQAFFLSHQLFIGWRLPKEGA